MKKIYDMFMFLNENDLLEIRINEHWDFVEKFIIIEAGQTHSGNKKPYNFDKQRFAKYSDKIVYIQHDSLDDLAVQYPELLDNNVHHLHVGNQKNKDAWKRENIQINSGILALKDLEVEVDDLVNWGGLDEIIRKEAYEAAYNGLFSQLDLKTAEVVVGFELDCYAYKFDLYHKKTGGAGITTFGMYKRHLPATMRVMGISHGLGKHYEVKNGGWHFCSVVEDDSRLLYKYKNFAHAQECLEAEDEESAIKKVFRDYNLKEVNIDKTFPKYLIENLEKYKNYIFNLKSVTTL